MPCSTATSTVSWRHGLDSGARGRRLSSRMIRLDHVTKSYKNSTVALRDVSINVDKGEFVFLVGPSGSGKSTFLRLLTKEENPDNGSIFVAGKDIAELSPWKVPYLRRNIGCV